jgi:methionyl-tRNA formyltransferase
MRPSPGRVLFLGSKRLGLRILEQMAVLRPEALVGAIVLDDREDGRSVFADFESTCESYGITMTAVSRRQEADDVIVRLAPDLCVVVGWYWLVDATMLARVPHGFVGIHNSLLPRYRGGAPLVWSLINGESEAGFSLFGLAPGIDAGPVWATGSLPVGPDEPIGSVLVRLEDLAVSTFSESYIPLLEGSLAPSVQDEARATYCCQRRPEDGQIDWSQPARAVHNFIRAQSDPYPGAFSFLDRQLLHVWSAAVSEEQWSGTPGQVARITAEEVLVVCGDGRCVALREVSVDDSRRPAPDVIRSINTRFPRVPVRYDSPAGMPAPGRGPADSVTNG